jgi:hypothetical protein
MQVEMNISGGMSNRTNSDDAGAQFENCSWTCSARVFFGHAENGSGLLGIARCPRRMKLIWRSSHLPIAERPTTVPPRELSKLVALGGPKCLPE